MGDGYHDPDAACTMGRSAGMSREDVRDLVTAAIREHELRVALWSGLLGAAVMAGTWHAIWLCRP